jgi:hypothetical protein
MVLLCNKTCSKHCYWSVSCTIWSRASALVLASKLNKSKKVRTSCKFSEAHVEVRWSEGQTFRSVVSCGSAAVLTQEQRTLALPSYNLRSPPFHWRFLRDMACLEEVGGREEKLTTSHSSIFPLPALVGPHIDYSRRLKHAICTNLGPLNTCLSGHSNDKCGCQECESVDTTTS